MATRRSRGEGGVHYSDSRERWIATAHVGFSADGKRIVKKVSGRTKTEAKNKLKEILRDLDDGHGVQGHKFTVEDAIRDWLEHGLSGRDPKTIASCQFLAERHVIPGLGRRRLRELTADDVDRWLAKEAQIVSTSTLSKMMSILRRSIQRQMARDRVKRNVALLCELPKGQAGRPVEVHDAGPGQGAARRRRGIEPERLHLALPADRRPHGGAACAHLGERRPRRRSRIKAAFATQCPALALRARHRRHQDQVLPAHGAAPHPLRGGAHHGTELRRVQFGSAPATGGRSTTSSSRHGTGGNWTPRT